MGIAALSFPCDFSLDNCRLGFSVRNYCFCFFLGSIQVFNQLINAINSPMNAINYHGVPNLCCPDLIGTFTLRYFVGCISFDDCPLGYFFLDFSFWVLALGTFVWDLPLTTPKVNGLDKHGNKKTRKTKLPTRASHQSKITADIL